MNFKLKKEYKGNIPKTDRFTFNKNELKSKIKPVILKKTNEVKLKNACCQLINDIHEKLDDGKCFNLDFIKSRLAVILSSEFKQEDAAKIMGISSRTLRNYIGKYGH